MAEGWRVEGVSGGTIGTNLLEKAREKAGSQVDFDENSMSDIMPSVASKKDGA